MKSFSTRLKSSDASRGSSLGRMSTAMTVTPSPSHPSTASPVIGLYTKHGSSGSVDFTVHSIDPSMSHEMSPITLSLGSFAADCPAACPASHSLLKPDFVTRRG
jgi:hypothetical protein